MPSCEDHGQRILNDRSRPRCDAFHRSPRSNFVGFRLPYRFYLTFIDLKQFALRLDRLPGLIRGKDSDGIRLPRAIFTERKCSVRVF